MNRQTKTFAQTMRGALLRAITCTALFAAPLIVVWYMTPVNMTVVAPEHGSIAERAEVAPAKGTQAWAIEKAGCESVEGVLPSGAVVSKVGANGGWFHVEGDRAVGRVFEQLVFDGHIPANEWTQPVDHGLRIGILCK